MKPIRLAIVTFGVLTSLAVTASSAHAAPILIGGSQTWLYNGTTAGCATCSATVTFDLLTDSSLKINIENTSTDGEAGKKILTALGLNTTPNLSGFSIVDQSFEDGSIWQLKNGVGGGNWELSLKGVNGISDGLDNQSNLLDGGWLTLAWANPDVASLGIDSTVVKFQAADANDLSLQAPGVPFVPPPPPPVPEPASLLLLGTGLSLGAYRIRRKKAAQA